MESLKTNEGELTSTMGNLMSTSKNDKTDASDSTPTSSTDAFTTTSTSHIAADDPISSTSSDISDSKKSTDKVKDVAQSSTNVINSNLSMSQLRDLSRSGQPSPIASEKDLLDMNITDTSTEKITENVDDIVQDLENLLGEPTASFDFTVRSRNYRKFEVSEDKGVPMDLDKFSAELQMLSEQTSEPKEIPKDTIRQTKNTEIETSESIKNHIKEDVKAENTLSDPTENVTEEITTDTGKNAVDNNILEPVSVEEPAPVKDVTPEPKKNIPKECIQEIGSSHPDADNKDNVGKNDDEKMEECQSEIISASSAIEKSKPSSSGDMSLVDPNTETLEEPECSSVTELPKEITDEQPNLSNSDNVEKISNSAVTMAVEEDKVDTETDKETDLISNAVANLAMASDEGKVDTETDKQTDLTSGSVANGAPFEEVKHVECEETTRQTEDTTVVEVKNQERVNEEDVEMKEETSASEDVNVSSKAVPEETKHVEEVQHSECSENMSEKEVTDNLTTKPDELEINTSLISESQKPESFTSTETQSDVQSQETDVSAVAEATEPMEQCESIKETSEGFVKTDRVEESFVKTDGVEKSFVKTDRVEEIGNIVEEQDQNLDADVTKREEQNQILEDVTKPGETQSEVAAGNTIEKPTQNLDDVTKQDETQSEVEADAVETQMNAMKEENVADPEEKQDTCVQLSQNVPEEIQAVCSSNVEATNSQIVASSDLPENCEKPEIITDVDEPKPEQNLEKMEIEVSPSEKINKEPESGTTELLSMEACQMETELNDQKETSEIGEDATSAPVEESKPLEDTIQISVEVPNLEDTVPDVSSVDFIPENAELSTPSPPEDLDLLVQNTINESISSAVSSIEEKLEETNTHLAVTEESISQLAVDVPDLEVLKAISTLTDDQSHTVSDIQQNIAGSDALLSSSTLEQPSSGDVAFDTNIDSALPTVDEIFADEDQQQIDEPDENLETLLAVASLQHVGYTMSPAEDFTPSLEQMSDFIPEESLMPQEVAPEEEKVESLARVEELSNIVDTTLVRENVVDEDVKSSEVAVDIEDSEIKRVAQEQKNNLKEPLVINVEVGEKERVYSPKITIKPIKPPEEEAMSCAGADVESSKGSLKMTITKQSDNTHSILKIYDPNNDNTQQDEPPPEPSVPKLIIKQVVQSNEQPQSPKMSTRSSKQVFSPSSSTNQRSASPRITIKPIQEPIAPLKITIKPMLKSEESHKQKHSPKLTIKTLLKSEEESTPEPKTHSPRVTIKPIVKPPEEGEQVASPRITIKPIVKPGEVQETTPRLTIKPVVKPSDKEKGAEMPETVERSSPKITIKPIVKPQETEPAPSEDFEESIKERIVLKINKGTIPGSSKESRKREIPVEEEKSEKLPKMKLKFSKAGGHPQIVQDQSPPAKRPSDQTDHDKSKRQKVETEHFLPAVTITSIAPSGHSKLKEMLSRGSNNASDRVMAIDDDVTLAEEPSKTSPIVISEESNQDSIAANAMDFRDPISEIPVFEITPDSVKTINPQPVAPPVEVPVVAPPAPRKRGRPRKVPLQVREDFKDPKEEEPKPVVVESTRPKRSCRGQSVRTTLGIKPRKPRGPGRGRGGKRGMGTRGAASSPPETPPRPAKEPKLGGTKLKELKEESFLLSDKSEVKTIEIDDGLQKSPSNSLLAPPQSDTSTTDRADIVMYEEETRMSAETSSRAQTPAKQVVTTIPAVDIVEESQSSVQSTATTESVKVRRGPRLEVHQEPEGAVISADQLAEYYWSGGGPFMLQEQVAQFLGIKSFKRKYPNIARRFVDMQERDFIRESGLAGEAMCDLGLTAVNSSDILDIMYSDFQDKYEEYCKHQRDRQAKDLINKQKALSLAASQEKAKMDITQQAVQSAASWNATFNKTRRDQRKSCMDLQTLTIHFPKGKMKQISQPKIGYYPVALVPGQYTDYYREFTPTEINNLPLSTLGYEHITRSSHQEMDCDSQTDGSGSDSDSSSSDSDSSFSGSSDGEDCTLCKPTPKRVAATQ